MPEIPIPFTIRPLTTDDLPSCTWSGTPTHLRYVRAELARADRGEIDYLALCPPSDLPVGLAYIDWTGDEDVGTIAQLTIHPALRGCGLGTFLVRAAEERIRARRRNRAELAVETTNRRARALYDRLGYRAYGETRAAWDTETPDGRVVRHEATMTLMRKSLRLPAR
ncbi:GNAT family N-acetyltransferase [Pseudonocardia thermophila]|uniref:GNAT family N-acetyltransferase n=1 Tax=Pseudonocardia thermophila TaxID=1848 RepID=UPI00248EC8F4|nr:GNAT family N-acetyltransferase [Pseudonocardia thermophila]